VAAEFPRRIVCLTEEPTEILYALGEGDRIVGISAYTCRPKEARDEKPVVSAFIGGNVDAIEELRPDLVLGFSDIQADLAKRLIERGLQVLIFNQRSIEEILEVILAVGRLVGAESRALELEREYRSRLDEARRRAHARQVRPRVYFEEWDDPTICGIRWVSELIEIAGGVDIFAAKARGGLARDRIVDHEDIRRAAPELVLASWCGKPFDRDAFLAREGFHALPAARAGRVHELDPAIILQPGPACLTDGLDAIVAALDGC
jgi:iron complex transport system substrate-binding protein